MDFVGKRLGYEPGSICNFKLIKGNGKPINGYVVWMIGRQWD
jgi:hypothetical protein